MPSSSQPPPIPNPSPNSHPNPSPKSRSYAAAAAGHGAPDSPPPSLTPNLVNRFMVAYPKPIVLPSPLVDDAFRPWSMALVGKFLGQAPSIEALSQDLASQWALEGEFDVVPMSHGFLCFRFRSIEERDRVLLGGPWVVGGAALALSPWSVHFRPSAAEPTRAVLWLRLPDLPPALWHRPILELIVAPAGRLLRLDTPTELLTKGRFAKVAVEVDLSKPIIPGTIVAAADNQFDQFWQPFEYESLHMLCYRCGRIGHRSATCKATPSLSPISVPVDSVAPPPPAPTPNEPPRTPPSPAASLHTTSDDTSNQNPWLLVRPRRRRPNSAAPPPPAPSTTSAGHSRHSVVTQMAATPKAVKPSLTNPLSKGPSSDTSEASLRGSATTPTPSTHAKPIPVPPTRSWPFGSIGLPTDEDLSRLSKEDQDIIQRLFAVDTAMADEDVDSDGTDEEFADASDADDTIVLGKLFPKGKCKSKFSALGPVKKLKKGISCKRS